jgi:hypothetical protein
VYITRRTVRRAAGAPRAARVLPYGTPGSQAGGRFRQRFAPHRTAPHPCELRRSPLGCHCTSGVNRQFRRGMDTREVTAYRSCTCAGSRPARCRPCAEPAAIIWPGRFRFAPTPVRFVSCPWIATVTQGSTDSFEWGSTGAEKCQFRAEKCQFRAEKCQFRTEKCQLSLRTEKCQFRTEKCQFRTEKCQFSLRTENCQFRTERNVS